jgi:hypothetical protein
MYTNAYTHAYAYTRMRIELRTFMNATYLPRHQVTHLVTLR